MTQATDVAQYILEKAGPMTTMKLQKLCYYSQGWSLAWDEVPMFPNTIEAWANGPVIRDLYRAHRGQFRVAKLDVGDASNLTQEQKDTVDAVLEGYGHLSGQQLSDMTHRESPWIDARGDAPDGAMSTVEIELEKMQDFFGALDSAQRA